MSQTYESYLQLAKKNVKDNWGEALVNYLLAYNINNNK